MDRTPHLFATDWYEDITPQLTKNAEKLGPGGVAVARNTKLFEALPACQVGTAKVDTGSPSEYKPLKVELSAVKAEVPLDSDEKLASYMDVVTAAEMAWHKGYSLLQTVLACLPIEHELGQLTTAKLQSLEFGSEKQESAAVLEYLQLKPGENNTESILQVFNWSVIRAVGFCMELAEGPGATAVFPEEDFHPTRYNLYFMESTPVQTVVELLERSKKQCAALGFKRVADRLALRINWLTVLKQRVPKKLVNLDKLSSQVEQWRSSSTSNSDAEVQEKYFSTGCQSRLDMASLRQQLINFSLSDAADYWQQILRAIRAFAPVYTISRSTDLLGFYLAFSSRREPPIVRAMARALTSETQILSQSTKQWALMDMNETMPPPGLKMQGKLLETFVSQASLCYTDLITVFCQNRCRMREGLSALIISFDSLQVSASQLDQQIHSNGDNMLVAADGTKVPPMYLSSWTYFRKLQVMLWTVLLSFETGVLNYSELAYTNWYASKLCQQLLTQLGRMRLAFEQYGHNARESPGYSYLVALELESQMLLQLCTALYMLWTAVHKLSPLVTNPNVSREMQFKLRFQAFESVGIPEMLELAEFDELAKNLEIETALQGAATASQTVRNMLSTLGTLATENIEIPLLKRSAMGISVAVATVIKHGKEPIKVETDSEGYHWYFPVPKISKKA